MSTFDDAVASVSDFAVSLLTTLPRAERSWSKGARTTSALGTIVIAVADARARLPGDDEIVNDLDRARAALASAIGAAAQDHPLAPLGPALDRTRALAVERTARAAVRAHEIAPEAPPLVASMGTPSLHRGVLLGAPPRPIAALSFGEMKRRSRSGAREGLPEHKALRRWARDALEELAVAGRLRIARDDEAWTSGRTWETRALEALDRLATLGRGASNDERIDVARVIEDMLREWSIPDPGRVFAATFALACLDGHGAAARLHVHARALAAMGPRAAPKPGTLDARLLPAMGPRATSNPSAHDARYLPGMGPQAAALSTMEPQASGAYDPYPAVASAIEDALSLGSSPHLHDVVLALLCEDDRPDLLARGLHVARRRRSAPANLVIGLLAHPDPGVAIAAARACAVLDPLVARAPLEEALFGPPEIAVHAAESLALLHAVSPAWTARLTGLTTVTGLTTSGAGDDDDDAEAVTINASVDPHAVLVPAVRLRVLHAGAREVDALLALCGALPREASLDLLGWLGSPRACDILIAALEDTQYSVRERAAWSLARITGAGLDGLGTIEVDEHGNPLHDPDREDLPEDHDHTRRIPPTDPGFWAEPAARARAAGAARLRFGRPLHAGAVVEELLDPRTHKGVRRVLVTELALLSGGSTPGLTAPLPLDPDDWIARQEQVLSLARDATGGGRS